MILGIITSILLSMFVSISVTKPIININNTAKNISNLDFSNKLTVKGEDELSELKNTINNLSDKLSIALSNLSEANKRLQKDIDIEKNLDKVRKEFMTNISHELKTPIANIKCYSLAIKEQIMIEKKERYINQIINQSDMMQKLIEDMLDLAKIENGDYKAIIQEFDLALLTNNIIEDTQILLKKNNLKLQKYFYDKTIMIKADRLKISQVIYNFLYNAIRHTNKNGTIFISINNINNVVIFEIENEGEHISEDKILKIWDRFYREKEDKNKKIGGSGLGLAISAKILQMHNMNYYSKNTKIGVAFSFEVKASRI